jgi:hypothetical protein
MIKYAINKDNSIIEFNTREEAVIYAPELEVFEVQEASPQIDLSPLYFKSRDFGEYLIDAFLIDNWNISSSISEEDSLYLLDKFTTIVLLLITGDIKTVKKLLLEIETDLIFTEDRKTKYINMINTYILNNYPTWTE